MAERGTKRGPKVPDKAKPVDKRRRSVSITNEMMRERQVFYSTRYFDILKVYSLNFISSFWFHLINFPL